MLPLRKDHHAVNQSISNQNEPFFYPGMDDFDRFCLRETHTSQSFRVKQHTHTHTHSLSSVRVIRSNSPSVSSFFENSTVDVFCSKNSWILKIWVENTHLYREVVTETVAERAKVRGKIYRIEGKAKDVNTKLVVYRKRVVPAFTLAYNSARDFRNRVDRSDGRRGQRWNGRLDSCKGFFTKSKSGSHVSAVGAHRGIVNIMFRGSGAGTETFRKRITARSLPGKLSSRGKNLTRGPLRNWTQFRRFISYSCNGWRL